MYLRADGSFLPVPADTKRYPRGDSTEVPRATYLPTLEHMQEIKDQLAPHLTDLAGGNGTSLGPFQISFIFNVRFQHVHDAYGRQDIPRHIIYRDETRESGANIYEPGLLLHMTRLLETYCDHIRRCPRPSCQRMFLQNRRHQEYCDRRCQSVAVMQKRRTEEKEKSKKITIDKKSGITASIKRGARHGKKRR